MIVYWRSTSHHKNCRNWTNKYREYLSCCCISHSISSSPSSWARKINKKSWITNQKAKNKSKNKRLIKCKKKNKQLKYNKRKNNKKVANNGNSLKMMNNKETKETGSNRTKTTVSCKLRKPHNSKVIKT